MDGILDSVGMSNLLLDFQCIRPGGTVVSIADGPDVALARALDADLTVAARPDVCLDGDEDDTRRP